MNKKLFLPFLSLFLLAGFVVINSCQKDALPTPEQKDYSFTQAFDSTQAMMQQGWVATNNSRPLGISTWSLGEYHWFNDPKKGIQPVGSYPGAATSHSGRDYVICTSGAQADPADITLPRGQASCWLMSPAVPMKNGDKIIFFTRTATNPSNLKDKLEVRLNLNNASVNVGDDQNSIGDFTTLALTVNDAFTTNGYPGEWTKYEYTVTGRPVPKMARFAFRYLVPDAGPGGKNGTGIGIDEVQFVSKYIP
jgi:hypothetical protein